MFRSPTIEGMLARHISFGRPGFADRFLFVSHVSGVSFSLFVATGPHFPGPPTIDSPLRFAAFFFAEFCVKIFFPSPPPFQSSSPPGIPLSPPAVIRIPFFLSELEQARGPPSTTPSSFPRYRVSFFPFYQDPKYFLPSVSAPPPPRFAGT